MVKNSHLISGRAHPSTLGILSVSIVVVVVVLCYYSGESKGEPEKVKTGRLRIFHVTTISQLLLSTANGK